MDSVWYNKAYVQKGFHLQKSMHAKLSQDVGAL